MTELNDLTFAQLDEYLQDKLESKPLPVVVIKKESDPQIRFDVFERLNTGAVPLNAQELRNCMYRGAFNDLLLELSTSLTLQELMGYPREGEPRMKDMELVLRFFAFYNSIPEEQYGKPMKRFLDREMERRRNLPDREQRELRNVFNQTMDSVKQVFGDRAFRRYDVRQQGGRWRTVPNVALYDVVTYAFAKRLTQRQRIAQMADSIREGLIVLLAGDDDFNAAIEQHTSDEERVRTRFQKWVHELDAIIGTPPRREPRLFSLQLKQELLDVDPTCAIDGQRIHDIDDAEIDHIEQYWKGGRTIPENARLVHRYCNRTRSRSSSS